MHKKASDTGCQVKSGVRHFLLAKSRQILNLTFFALVECQTPKLLLFNDNEMLLLCVSIAAERGKSIDTDGTFYEFGSVYFFVPYRRSLVACDAGLEVHKQKNAEKADEKQS